ncbi:hypothetical protein [Polynucleobacter sp.]|uniref:hypothetical protein n=1 Tax=Polynucleobacter sp. TaxID=2029855 RepID=UPI003F69A98C
MNSNFLYSNEYPLSQSDNIAISDLDLCTQRYVEGIQKQSFYLGKEETRKDQINDLRLENIILKILLVYLATK